MLTFFFVILICLAVFILWCMGGAKERSMQNMEYQKAHDEMNRLSINPTKTFESKFWRMFVSLDDDNDKLFMFQEGKTKACSFKDVLSVELIIDGHSSEVYKSTLGTVGGAVLGGAIAGSTGALIGGLSSSASSSEFVETLLVHVAFRDMDDSFDFNFLKDPSDTSSQFYKDRRLEAQSVIDMFRYAIDKANRNGGSVGTESVSDELARLSQLHRDGALTDEEFSALKAKIINR